MREQTYRTHQKILGAIFIAYGAINLLGGITLLAAGNIVSIVVDDMEVVQLVTIISRLVGSTLVITSVPGVIAGIGYIQEKYWARNLGLIMGIIYLIYIPIGTVVGIYTIWLSSQRVIKEKEPVYASDLVNK